MPEKYPEPTDAQVKQITKLFKDNRVEPAVITVRSVGKSYKVEAKQMYDYVEFKEGSFLTNVGKISDILDCKEGDEEDRYSQGGCDTCDWGSSYEIYWRFWNP